MNLGTFVWLWKAKPECFLARRSCFVIRVSILYLDGKDGAIRYLQIDGEANVTSLCGRPRCGYDELRRHSTFPARGRRAENIEIKQLSHSNISRQNTIHLPKEALRTSTPHDYGIAHTQVLSTR